jgi:DNA ligase-1
MRSFAKLLSEIEQTNSTNEKVDIMAEFFIHADLDTAAWVLYFLAGQRPKKLISSKLLREWAEEIAGLPPWLGEECYSAVGDTAEMIALIMAPWINSKRNYNTVLPAPEVPGQMALETTAENAPEYLLAAIPAEPPTSQTVAKDIPLGSWMRDQLEPLRALDLPTQKAVVQKWWKSITTRETFVLNKLMTGGLRIGVSETLVYRSLSQAFNLPRPTVAARLLGKWNASAEFFARVIRPVETPGDGAIGSDGSAPHLSGNGGARGPGGHCAGEANEENAALPIPFCLAAPFEGLPQDLGPIEEWQIEWKWDGIRAQVVKKRDVVELWSRGEERITESFPDLVQFFAKIPEDFTIDGELLAGQVSRVGSFNDLQKRLNRKNASAVFLRENPVVFFAYDLLRQGDQTLTGQPQALRRLALENFVTTYHANQFGISTLLALETWEKAKVQQSQAREMRAEGLMLKRKSAPYGTGRKRGIWFKWKVDPLSLDVVLTAAQPGSGRRASLYTDYTFGIWKGAVLVPIAKAYSGLTDEEIKEVDQWIRRNTLERHGPVRILTPQRVFEIGFEGIAESNRHKSGFAVRFPRILRERTDKPAAEADTVETVRALFNALQTSPKNSDPISPESSDG